MFNQDSGIKAIKPLDSYKSVALYLIVNEKPAQERNMKFMSWPFVGHVFIVIILSMTKRYYLVAYFSNINENLWG